MIKGFVFNQNKCVGCHACSVACILENRWEVTPRIVYKNNPDNNISLPVINLSLACNHCKKSLCLEGCPSRSYFVDESTGAVIIDDKKCIGCKYCQWNCPYDAPKFNRAKKVIGKCNLCYTMLHEGGVPACTSACPTGALNYSDITEISSNLPSWFPDNNLYPAINFTGSQEILPLKIIPEDKFETETIVSKEEKQFRRGEWSLIAFSFLSTLSVSIILSSLIKGVFPDLLILFVLTSLAALSSLFHLGKITRAWRAVINLKSSPLSREIALFIVFSLVALTAAYLETPALLIISSLAGLLLLVSIDAVYHYPEVSKYSKLHSGQTLISSLLIISFLSESIIPFVFIVLVKTGLFFYRASSTDIAYPILILRTLRLAFLVISSVILIYSSSFSNFVLIIFLTGELIDRIIFYLDFEPSNINKLIKEQLINVSK